MSQGDGFNSTRPKTATSHPDPYRQPTTVVMGGELYPELDGHVFSVSRHGAFYMAPEAPARAKIYGPIRGAEAPFIAESDTSRAAAESIEPHLQYLQTVVLREYAHSPQGLTCDDVERLTSLRHQTASARVKELRDMGKIVDSGRRAKTRSGRSAVVYVVSK